MIKNKISRMAAWINPNILRESGFRDFEAEEEVEAEFYCIRVFKIRGYIFDDDAFTIEAEGEVEGARYRLGIGNSTNTVCRRLLGDDLVEDEKTWSEERKTTPPYLLLHFGPTSKHSCNEGVIKRTESGITTYQCYKEAAAELRILEGKILSCVVTALTVRLSSDQHSISLVPVQRIVYGTTTEGETLRDFTITGSGASIWTSIRIEESKLREQLELATTTAISVYRKAAKFFHLGLDEEDRLKRFLYFFLCIEVLTQYTFRSIDQCQNSMRAVTPPERVADSAGALFLRQLKEIRGIADRFVWCAACVWKSIDDSDVAEFMRLKDIRDGIAHGRIEEPKLESSQSAEKLAMKLLRDI